MLRQYSMYPNQMKIFTPAQPSGKETKFSSSNTQDSPFIEVSDSDEGDKVFVTLQAEGGTLSTQLIGASDSRITVEEANTLLQALTLQAQQEGKPLYQ